MNLTNTLKLINEIGAEDSEKITSTFDIIANIPKEIEKFSDIKSGLAYIMITANTGFNMLLKHRSVYEKYCNIPASEMDDLLKNLHQIELTFEAELENA